MLAVDDQRPGPPIPATMNLAGHVLFGSAQPDAKTALSVLGQTGTTDWSFGELRHAVLKTAGGFASLGLAPGARVLMRLGNTPDFPIVFLGAIAAGLCPVPTSNMLTQVEITKIARVLSPDMIVAAPGILLPETSGPATSPEVLAAGQPLATPKEVDSNAPAYIVFTSGTSGQPMGVVHAHRAILARKMMVDGWYGLTPADRMLHAGAFNWTFTLGTGLLDPWTIGATALILAEGTPPEAMPNLAQANEATLLAGAPGVFRRLLKNELPPLPALRHGLVAGEKLAEPLRDAWRDKTGTELYEAFGQSECSTFISASPARTAPEGTLGFAQPGRAVAILDGDKPAKRGDLGEIAVHASDPGLCLGYLSRSQDIRGTWCLTGDLGLMRDDGAIEYHGRRDDVLTAGGFRISPIEVETAMERHPSIDAAAAVDHPLDAETTVIALHYTGSPVDDTALRQHAARHLARYKEPRLFIHEQNLPRNANGKLLRIALRTAKPAP